MLIWSRAIQTAFDGPPRPLTDRCAHRASMYFGTKTALLSDSAPTAFFTFDDVPASVSNRDPKTVSQWFSGPRER